MPILSLPKLLQSSSSGCSGGSASSRRAEGHSQGQWPRPGPAPSRAQTPSLVCELLKGRPRLGLPRIFPHKAWHGDGHPWMPVALGKNEEAQTLLRAGGESHRHGRAHKWPVECEPGGNCFFL